MPVDDVLRAHAEQITDTFGGLTVRAAGAALDMAMADYLHVSLYAEGPSETSHAALRFVETALPYTNPEPGRAFKEIRESVLSQHPGPLAIEEDGDE